MKTTFTVFRLLYLSLFLLVISATLIACGEGGGADEAAIDTVAADTAAGLLGDMTVAELVSSEPRFSLFATALDSSGLRASFEKPGRFTVFLPTNAAFNAVYSPDSMEALLRPEHRERLQELVTYHITEEQVMPGSLPADSLATTLQGGDLSVRQGGGGKISVNGMEVVTAEPTVARNGVIYVVGTLLTPGVTAQPPPP